MPCLITYAAELMVSHHLQRDHLKEHKNTPTERVTGETAVIAGKNQWDWIGHGCFNAGVTLARGSAGALMTNQRGLVINFLGTTRDRLFEGLRTCF